MRGSRGVKSKPRNVLLYGEHGTGKTTLASTFPGVYLIDVEGGSDDIDIWRSDRVKTFDDFQNEINWLLTGEHDARTVAVDTVDWLEKLVQQNLASRDGKKSIEDFGYGKGYTFSSEEFERIILSFRALNSRGMAVLLLGHAKTVKHHPPEGETYERWEPDLHDKVLGPMVEFCDEVLFLKKRTFTKKEDVGFNKERNIVIGTDERVLVCCDTGSVVAKNRLQMPNEIPADFGSYAAYVMAARQRAAPVIEKSPTDITGLVVNGSSKVTPSNEAARELAETNVF